MKLSKLIYLAIVFSIAFLGTTRAQVQKDTLVAFRYFQKADSLKDKGRFKNSIYYFKKAIPLYKREEVWSRVASCYNMISENQWRVEDLEKSLLYANRAIEISDLYLGDSSKSKAISFDNIGKYYQIKADFDSALSFYKKALDNRKKTRPKGHESLAVSYSNIGIVYQTLSKYRKALYYQNKGLSINIMTFGPEHLRTGRDYNDVGNTYQALGELYTALEYFNKDLNITIKNQGEDHLYAGYNYNNIGNVYEQLNQYEKALAYYEKARSIFIKTESEYPAFVIYSNIQHLLSNIGEYEKALQFYKKSINIGSKVLGENHPHIAISYWNAGVIFENKGNYEEALIHYNKALKIFNFVYKENHDDVAKLYTSIGDLYIVQKKYEEGLKYLRLSAEIYDEIFDKDNLEVSSVYMKMAKIYLKNNDSKEANKYTLKGLKVLSAKLEESSPSVLGTLNQMANLYNEQGDFQNALYYFDKALSINLKTKISNVKDEIFTPKNYYNSKFLLETLRGKARILQVEYERSAKKTNLIQSINIYKEIDVVINDIRNTYKNYQDKILFSKEVKEIYADAIQANLVMYEDYQKEEALESAFYYAEKSKANTLKELLSESTSKGFANIPEGLLSIEKTIKTDRAFYQSQIIDEKSKEEVDSIKISTFENKLFDLNRKQDSLTQVLEKEYPKYHQLKYQDDIITVAGIQKNLSAKTTLLEFFSADSITYALIITKNKLEVQELSTPNILEKTKEFREAITSKDVRKYKRVGHSLYTTLITPIQNKIVGNELVIVPDGPLWHLNFDLLLTQNTTSNNPKALPYFLRDYAITYANSANLVFTSFKTNATNNTTPLEECLAFSFSDTTSTNVVDAKAMSMATLRGAKSDLPGTRREIQEISKIIDGQYYFGSEAIEANFKKKAGQYNILHLALHGEVDNDRPENSKLFFTKSKDTLEDNLLYAHELFALDIPAELTVLSACNTGSGKIAKGEGIMSLGTAFQYAGTKSLLLTSWEVPDQTTPEVMKYFYSNLKKGLNKGQALQQAKLEYLKTAKADRADPFYWGSFYLVGDSGAMHFNNITSWYWVFGIGILCILGYLMYRYKTRQT
ncbi:CHAT domain-containing protein [Aquimarina sp. AD10]|uniref:CHAT domain-containing protein n=1 Tax=Aquimarina sp. AD10 TaxID=1714849 RepID=UPI000E4E5B07|nr:CHAT domain-containing tetratricopeptide repeat protein [Aquimarina sp. AD10]AXT62108.1 CHAT domain-containing protein [Aquimarina sp. AD10]RKM99904.1 CHAT domain-containing protein [Aquimarina sp. AD10]